MSNPFWKRFPTLPGLHCVEMKDHVQGRVREETRDATPEGLVAYFHEASRHFWREIGRAYPESAATLMTVKESDQRHKTEVSTVTTLSEISGHVRY